MDNTNDAVRLQAQFITLFARVARSVANLEMAVAELLPTEKATYAEGLRQDAQVLSEHLVGLQQEAEKISNK